MEFFPTGNASAFHGILKAREAIARHPGAVCLVGGTDSLLSPDTLAWLEKDWRLVTEEPNRSQGVFPSQAAGFFILESEENLKKMGLLPVATLTGCAMANESSPFTGNHPCKGEGLTRAIRLALKDSDIPPARVDSVFCDLNGEYHRFKEWGFAHLRCFPHRDDELKIFHPADCMGDVGAAWLPVLVSVAAAAMDRGETEGHTLVFCSDDHGERGAVILGSA
jgi:3-oxoacyl-[acyl-carrier-protein] synthase-1